MMNIRNSVYVYVYLDCYKRVAIVEATRPLSSLSSPLFSPPFFFFSILVSLSLYWRIHYHRGIFLPNLLDLSMPRECDSISSSCVDIIKGREEEYKQIYLSIYICVCVFSCRYSIARQRRLISFRGNKMKRKTSRNENRPPSIFSTYNNIYRLFLLLFSIPLPTFRIAVDVSLPEKRDTRAWAI